MNNDNLSQENQNLLVKIARDSIQHGLQHGKALPINASDYPAELLVSRAVFVTLTIEGELRGCIGCLEANDSLIANVAKYAFLAAFRDSRFSELSRSEFPALEIHISILSPVEPMEFSSEEDLISKIRPGIDGLLLQDGMYRGTFLPSVWEDLADPRIFLKRLKGKAGLPADHWSASLKISRYTVSSIASIPHK